LLFKTNAAQNGPPLRRLERYSGCSAALGACGPRLCAHLGATTDALCLALFAVFGIVLELFIVEEELLARCEDKIRAAIYTFQGSISKFHSRLPQNREQAEIGHGFFKLVIPVSLYLSVDPQLGPGPQK
jgi:hypothetical protein